MRCQAATALASIWATSRRLGLRAPVTRLTRLFSVIALLLFGNACCDDRELPQVPSPDGKLIASVLVNNCGATTPFYLYVFLRHSGAFVGPFGIGKTTVFAQQSANSADIEWVGPRELLIRAQRAKVLYRLERWEDVTIRVEEKPLLL